MWSPLWYTTFVVAGKRNLWSGLRLFYAKQALAQVWNQYLQGLMAMEPILGEVQRELTKTNIVL